MFLFYIYNWYNLATKNLAIEINLKALGHTFNEDITDECNTTCEVSKK